MLLASFAALFAISAAARLPGSRIVDGVPADRKEFPYQLSLQLDGSHICGAVAIDKDFVITAAHCVDFAGYEPSRFSFVCGLHDISDQGQRALAQTIVMHPQWNPNGQGFPNDIAIVKVDQPFVFNDECQSANLPPQSNKDYADKDSRISGWGRLYGNGPVAVTLKKANIPTITNTVCGRDYNNIIFTVIRDFHICVKDPAAIQGACNGDSGGPLTSPDYETGRDKVVGLTSFGRTGCDTRYASVYTRVSYYRNWIDQQMDALRR